MPRYLDDELNRVALAINQLNSRVLNAIPWKGYMVKAAGQATTALTLTNTYNIASLLYTGQTAEAVQYRGTLQYASIQGVTVLDKVYPSIVPVISPTNLPADTNVFFTRYDPFDIPGGRFDIWLSGGQVPASGKLTLVAYELNTGDVMYVQGLFNIETDASVVAFNLGVLGDF